MWRPSGRLQAFTPKRSPTAPRLGVLRHPRRLALVLASGLLGLSLTCASAPLLAQAQAPQRRPQEAAAKASFEAAQKLYDQRKFADALVLFRTAHEASGSPNAEFMVARCLIELGALAEAYDKLQSTMRAAAALAADSPKYAHTRDTAATDIAALERRIGRLVILAPQLDAGATVTVNGAVIPAARLGAPFAVDPGTKLVELTRPGVAPFRREVTVPIGEMKTVTLEPPTAAPAAPLAPLATPPVTPPEAPSEPAATGGGVRVAGFVVTGVGVAGAALFAVTATLAASNFSTLEKACGGVRCVDPIYTGVVDRGRALETASYVGLAAGVVGLVSGGLMIALGGPTKAPAHAALAASPTAAQLRYELTF